MKSVVFDIGNVLLDWDPKRIFKGVLEDDKQIEQFLSEINFTDWNVGLDKSGKFENAVKLLSQKHPHHAEKIRMFDTHWLKSISGTIESSIEVLQVLNATNIPLYAITNFSAEKWIVAYENFPFLKTSFIDVVVSAQVEIVKPAPEIFKLFLSRNSLKADDCIFIDDSDVNIKAAEQVGFDVIHFNRETKLAEELKSKGLEF